MKSKLTALALTIYGISAMLTIVSFAKTTIDTQGVAAMCLSSQFPSVAFDETSGQVEGVSAAESEATKGSQTQVADVPETSAKSTSDKPRVLIVHTHATESYMPASGGNFHTTSEANTVRDAGNVMAAELEEEGIGVVHDKTLHDNPSYDGSYSRSYNTIAAILKKYPTIECIIDLHRDATAAQIDGPTETVDGKTCAVYSYVLSNGTATYSANKEFLGRLNTVARDSFSGFTGSILERPYWYNQELSGKSILIELGNNRNNIEDVRQTAKVFGKILAKGLK